MKSPLVSVCIANYNGEEVIGECIDSILVQDYNNLEIIVHDDCSTDNSIEVLKQYKDQIQIITSQENVGYCISNNRMANVANGIYLLLFNNDAVLAKNGISELITAVKEGDYGILTLVQKDYYSKKIIDSGRDLDIFLNPIPRKQENVNYQQVMTVHGACLFISRDLWVNLGGFPVFYESVAEDLYLCLAAQAKGILVGSVNTAYFIHRNGLSFGGGGLDNGRLNTTIKRRYLSERNKLLTMYLLYSGIFKIIPYIAVLTLLFEGLILSLLQRKVSILINIYLKAIWDFIKLIFNNITDQLSVKLPNLPYSFLMNLKLTPYKFTMLLKYGLPIISKNKEQKKS